MNLLHMANRGLPRRGLIALYDPYRQYATSSERQLLLDYSGKGNHAQLGSAAGADTNDPTFNATNLQFGADDFAKSANSAFDDLQQFTYIGVFEAKSLGGSSLGRIWDKTQKLLLTDTGNTIRFGQTLSGGLRDWRSVSTFTFNKPQIIGVIYDATSPLVAPVMWFGNVKSNLTLVTNSVGSVVSDASSDLYCGNASSAARNFDGSMYIPGIWYNRIIPDAEYLRAYYYLKSLLNSRGVSIA